MGGQLRGCQVFDSARAAPVTGRMIAMGLHDELSDTRDVIVDVPSGRFAMLDDGVGFSRVSRRPVIEKRLGSNSARSSMTVGLIWKSGPLTLRSASGHERFAMVLHFPRLAWKRLRNH
jgi:hypothetical protein